MGVGMFYRVRFVIMFILHLYQYILLYTKYFSFHVVPVYSESDHLKWLCDNFLTIG